MEPYIRLRGPLPGPLGGIIESMSLGDHPMRTPVYGGLLIVGAMVGATLVWQAGLASWLRNALMLLALVMAIAGWLMTFRDLSRPRRRR